MQNWTEILAILLSPIVAVLVGKYLQDRKQLKERQFNLFFTLASRRHETLDSDCVRALNAIDIIFSRSKSVRALWKEYLSLTSQQSTTLISKAVNDKYIEILHAMAKELGYDKTISQITISTSYYPNILASQAETNEKALELFMELLEGHRPLLIKSQKESNDNSVTQQADE